MSRVVKHKVYKQELTVKEASELYNIPHSVLNGRIHHSNMSLKEAIDMGQSKRSRIKTGDKFGNLTCTNRTKKSINSNAVYEMQCDCGNLVDVLGLTLKQGTRTSCNNSGCQYSKRIHHNMSNKPEYNTWLNIKQRCTNPNNKAYPYYGGRGIEMCSEWANDFTVFLSDVGEKPFPDYSIERIDVDGNYDPANVTWIPISEQSSNRRNVIKLTQKIEYLESLLTKHNILFLAEATDLGSRLDLAPYQ